MSGNGFIASHWGKSAADGWHPLAYHCLDVAAVGAALLATHPRLAGRIEDLVPGLSPALPLWLALHDLGKFAGSFQCKVPDLHARLSGRADPAANLGARHHADLGLLLWSAGRVPLGRWAEAVWAPLAEAVFGHHGVPGQDPSFGGDRPEQFFQPDDLAAAGAFARAAVDLLGADPPEGAAPAKVRLASWLVAGIAVLADWIGSNRDWFPYRAPDPPLADYWALARQRAETALTAAGIVPALAAPGAGFAGLFPGYAPTPVQAAAVSLELAEGPQLIVIEDLTGAGKTEAALLLAHRLMAGGRSEGLYVGLPTQATANAMFGRMGAVYRRLFADGKAPSLVLAHGRAADHPGFRAIATLGSAPAGEAGEDGRDTASAQCAAWIADSRKKALLAEVGVGTLDQALLCVLPARHSVLRLAGLAGKVLIADEVHAFDSYTRGLLGRLLTLHAALGGSAVVLSATLAAAQRRELLAAFADGRRLAEGGRRPVEGPSCDSGAFPLLTHWAPGMAEAGEIPCAAAAGKAFRVRRLGSFDETVAAVLALASEGGCVAWVRNTVADAREAHAALRAAGLAGDRLALFHSGFALADRQDIEAATIDAFGKDSTPEGRAGRVLVATQVVEQSLDLDFDHMVADLAPVDLLIQRAGRLHRHPGRPRPGGPVLHLLAPDPDREPDAGWYKALLPRAAFVYRDHGRLWLSARVLLEAEGRGGVRLPEDARWLVEAVHGPDAEAAVPPALAAASRQAAGDALAEAYFAAENAVKPGKGYGREAAARWGAEAMAPTRLADDPRGLLRLARVTERGIVPWAPGDDAAAWRASEVPVALRRVDGEAAPPPALAGRVAALKAQWGPDPDSLLVLLEPGGDDTWTGRASKDGREVTVRYDRRFGLVVG